MIEIICFINYINNNHYNNNNNKKKRMKKRKENKNAFQRYFDNYTIQLKFLLSILLSSNYNRLIIIVSSP